MAHKTFISYKYSESQELRDKIINAMGADARYYKGEDGYSEDLTGKKSETIKKRLSDMIYDTSVTIVIISPHMLDSQWMEWEVKYSLKELTRQDKTSGTNGVVGVIKKVNNSYDWIENTYDKPDGCKTVCYDENKLFEIINKNRFNQEPKEYACPRCKTVNALTGSYISLVKEDDFLNDIDKYIENAYKKSTSDKERYNICKMSLTKEEAYRDLVRQINMDMS